MSKQQEFMEISAWNALTGEESKIRVPIIGYDPIHGLPILGLKMMSDERWMELVEQRERERERQRRESA